MSLATRQVYIYIANRSISTVNRSIYILLIDILLLICLLLTNTYVYITLLAGVCLVSSALSCYYRHVQSIIYGTSIQTRFLHEIAHKMSS